MAKQKNAQKIQDQTSLYSWFKGKKIAFIGDSVTADLTGNYVTMVADRLASLLDASSIEIINSGVDSSSVLDALDRLPDVLIESDPDVFVFFLGINDSKIFRQIDRPLLSSTEFEKSYTSLLDLADAERQRLKILVTIPPLLFEKIKNGTLLEKYWYWIPADYEKYVKAIRKIAIRKNCVIADVYNQFQNPNTKLDKLFKDDGVHPNIYGHRLIADTVMKSLLNLCNNRSMSAD